jgi:branched-chain amino acid aminotransferase
MSTNPPYVWLDGQLTPWDKATVHMTQLGTASVSSVFEGIRGYWNADQKKLYVFQLDAHVKRFAQSIRLIRLPSLDVSNVKQGVIDLLRANGANDDIYIRPFAYAEAAQFGGLPSDKAHIIVSTQPWTSRLMTDKMNHAVVVSWTRISDNVLPPRIKASSNYLNSRYASQEAQRHGYDSAILLNHVGKVAEGPGACLMLVRNGTLITPGITSGILESITRETIIEIARDLLGLKVVEREVDRTELYVADEVFFCGTGAEITPVASVDRFTVGDGKMGPVTTRLMKLYNDIVRGIDSRCPEWRTPV